MKRYLVTGGAGFIGAAVTKKLLGLGHFVRVFDNQSRGSQRSLEKSSLMQFIEGDIRNLKDVNLACKGIDAIIHLAYVNGTKYFYEKPDLVLEVGVKGMINILEGGKNHKVKELFLASSSEVYQTPPIIPTPESVPYLIPDPLNPRYSYAGGKIISEMLSLYVGKNVFDKIVIFRPHNVYGPGMGYEHVIPELIMKIIKLTKRKQKKISLSIQGDGKDTRAFIFIDDFVDALVLLLDRGRNRQIYNIGTEKEISVKKLVDLLSVVSKTDITIKSGDTPKGSTKRRCPDISKISKLGFKSKISLPDGLTKTFLWYNQNSAF